MNNIIWPTKSKRITSPFGPRSLSADGFHDGLDIGPKEVGEHEDVFAVADWNCVMSYTSNSWGETVILEHDGFCSIYAHLSRRAVKEGQSGNQGQVIGLMGSTGHSTGVHLHFELRDTMFNNYFWRKEDGKYLNAVDPDLYLMDEEQEEPDHNLLYLLDQGILDDGDYWQNLIDRDALCSDVPVKILIALAKKIVERD